MLFVANDNETRLADAVTERDHALGPAAAPITIVEYGDYECPDCFNAVPIIEKVRQELAERLRFVFRHFPQSSIHPHASAAAEAAEASAAEATEAGEADEVQDVDDVADEAAAQDSDEDDAEAGDEDGKPAGDA